MNAPLIQNRRHRKVARLLVALALLFAASALTAEPLTITITGTGSGTLNGNSFSSTFKFVMTADTTGLMNPPCCTTLDTPSGSPTTFEITGVDSGTLTDNQAVFLDSSFGTIGLAHFNDGDIVDLDNSALAGYSYASSLGPLTGTPSFVGACPGTDCSSFTTNKGVLSFSSVTTVTFNIVVGALPPATALRDAADPRALLMGAAADSDEFGQPNRLAESDYAATLAAQYNMLEPENAMKWNPIHPAQTTYNFEPGDKLAAFAQAHMMKVRGHNLLWHSYNPDWLVAYAKSATSAQMAAVLNDHIDTVVGHYQGQAFAWDVVNEAISDSATGSGTGSDLRDSIWYNQPGIGTTGDGFIEQAFRWAHAADPNALLFYNEYGVEAPGPKFNALYNIVKDLLSRGTPINGVGIQMHLDLSGYPSSAGLAQNIQQLGALGLQVHITEMDVRIPVDSNGVASAANLQAQADTYQRIMTVCLENPACTAFQTWGFTDKYSWIPSTFAGLGAALPFDANYQPKPAVAAMVDALQNAPPSITTAGIVNAASYKGGAVSPGELVTLFQVNYGPTTLTHATLTNNAFPTNIAGSQVFFDGIAAPLIYSEAGIVSAVVPFEVAGKQQTEVQYQYNNMKSATVTVPVAESAPGIFAANSSGSGQGSILNDDGTRNSASHPIVSDGTHRIQIFATGGGSFTTTPVDGQLAPGMKNKTILDVTGTIGGLDAQVHYAGAAPGLLNGVLQVNLQVPAGLSSGPQPVVIKVGGVPTQNGITVQVK